MVMLNAPKAGLFGSAASQSGMLLVSNTVLKNAVE